MAGVDLDGDLNPTIARLERSMLTSWPALATAFDGDWVIRLARGMTKRSNSVTCLGDDALDLEARIDRVEAIFARHRLPPVFRLSPLAPPALDRLLARRGWRRFDDSIVMTVDLADTSFDGTDGDDADGSQSEIMIDLALEPSWLNACARIDGLSTTDRTTLRQMLENLLPIAGFGRLEVNDDAAALALAVVDIELVGLFEVMTAAEHRRQGLSRRLLRQLLAFGRDHAATMAWLAVAEANPPAVNLYRSIGFRDVYRYHYRIRD